MGLTHHQHAPRLLLTFVALSLLGHGIILLWFSPPETSQRTVALGVNHLSTVLLSREEDTPAVNETRTPQPATPAPASPASHPNILATEKKPAHSPQQTNPAETQPALVAKDKPEDKPEKAGLRASTPQTADTGISRIPRPSVQSRQAAQQRDTQRNFLLGELNHRLKRYLTYPPRARRRGWEGEVRIAMHITARGQLRHIRLAKSSGYALLDRAALNAVHQLKKISLPTSLGILQATDLLLPVRYQLREG